MLDSPRPHAPFNWTAVAVAIAAAAVLLTGGGVIAGGVWAVGAIRTEMQAQIGQVTAAIAAATAEITGVQHSLDEFKADMRSEVSQLRAGLDQKADRYSWPEHDSPDRHIR